MKKLAITLCLAITFAVPIFAQGPTWTTSTIQKYNGYDYELWNENNQGTVSMKLTGDNGSSVGGTFTAQWSGTKNVLFRSGRKFTNTSGQSVDGGGQGKTAAALGNISINFAATWSSNDNVKMLGVYGWAFFASGSQPSNFSNQIEYYIIQDRGSYNSATSGTNSTKKGSATIDGIAYDFYVCDRMGQPMLTGNGNFKQYFSVPSNTGSHRTSGTITVSKHFEEWAKVGMKMDGPLYEVAMKVESYSGNGQSNGSATITKNLLTIGGGSTTPSSSSVAPSSSSRPSSSSVAPSSSSRPSSSSVAASSSSRASSSSVASSSSRASSSSVASSSSRASSSSSVAGTGGSSSSNASGGASSSSVVAGGSSSSTNASGTSSSSAAEVSSSSEEDLSPILRNRVPVTYFSIQPLSDKSLRIEISSPAVVEIFDLKGNKVEKFNISSTRQTVKLSSPSGIYFAKVHGMKSIRFVLK
ncbi:MAG: T9SS type A sorting domain-containing protein [Fibromonadaceae bacterium]|jgi:hypothetical protein|nr:T9SS type A sorting domain-containing protein [Fibromonadaceae bacterium]